MDKTWKFKSVLKSNFLITYFNEQYHDFIFYTTERAGDFSLIFSQNLVAYIIIGYALFSFCKMWNLTLRLKCRLTVFVLC